MKLDSLAVWLRTFAVGRVATQAGPLEQAAKEIDRLKEVDDLPFRVSDIKRSLIMFRTSSNAHGFTNYQSRTEKVDNLPSVAKEELAGLMFGVAFDIDPVEMMRRAAQMRKAIEEGRVPSWPKDVELPK